MRIALSTGEPAGIGPDLCLQIALDAWPHALVAVGDRDFLDARARALDLTLELPVFDPATPRTAHRPGVLPILHTPLAAPVRAGKLDPSNAPYVLDVIDRCVAGCSSRQFDALVTAPVHKGIINDAGHAFSGHTEYIAQATGAATPVMMLCAGDFRVALATTHLPLRAVSDAIRPDSLTAVIEVLHHGLRARFGLSEPVILVCGLNPHAGEGGHLGHEEIEIISPVLEKLRLRGMRLVGPVPADTAFTPTQLAGTDAVLAMYHDQGLPVLKHAGFGDAVNLTLGLPILRLSVDHGTALDLAGSGRAQAGSLRAAVRMAASLLPAPV